MNKYQGYFIISSSVGAIKMYTVRAIKGHERSNVPNNSRQGSWAFSHVRRYALSI